MMRKKDKRLIVVGDRVLIAIEEGEERTKVGLYLPPTAVDCLVPCGLGIPNHDRAELAGLHNVFGGGLERVPMSAIKAQTGHLAAGCGVNAAAAVLAVHNGVIPPSKNTVKPVEGLKLNASQEARQANVNVSVSSVYSLGGQNAALVFKKI